MVLDVLRVAARGAVHLKTSLQLLASATTRTSRLSVRRRRLASTINAANSEATLASEAAVAVSPTSLEAELVAQAVQGAIERVAVLVDITHAII